MAPTVAKPPLLALPSVALAFTIPIITVITTAATLEVAKTLLG